MSGAYKGVAARVRCENAQAIYIHCNAHILNLILVDAAKAVAPARNALGTICQLHNFIEGSAKRHAVFEAVQTAAGLTKLTIKGLSDTRWTCRADALRCVKKRLEEIIEALEDISENDAASGAEADSL